MRGCSQEDLVVLGRGRSLPVYTFDVVNFEIVGVVRVFCYVW